ncbi:MAG: YceI family protein [Proteobacteria bacterium]|nr:YceI family protein [Pseudomonadota bacterium]
MRSKKGAPALLALAALWTLGLAPAQATAGAKGVVWKLDTVHSSVGFAVRHLGLSTVRGHFEAFAAEVQAEALTGKITALRATAQTATINTGNARRDAHLKSDDFFNAPAYPTLRLELRRINWKGTDFEVLVDLTIRDVSKPVVFKGSLIGTHDVDFGDGRQRRAGYSAEATIDRHAFGLKFGKLAEGVAVVGAQVKIQIDLQISRRLGATPSPSASPSATPTVSRLGKKG